jgi:transcription antitermination factor NusB
MLKLDEKVRDEIVQVLQVQVVPAIAGSVLVQIANILSRLEVIEVQIPKEQDQAIKNKEILQNEISKVTPNWDNERIAQIDLILLQMCLSEFLFFKSIPLKVSINEYLEIAKEYSSDKSNIFINGIMDSLSKQFENEGRINKNKRGLQLFTIFNDI